MIETYIIESSVTHFETSFLKVTDLSNFEKLVLSNKN